MIIIIIIITTSVVWCVKDLLAQRQLNQDKIDEAKKELMLYVEVCEHSHLLTYLLTYLL